MTSLNAAHIHNLIHMARHHIARITTSRVPLSEFVSLEIETAQEFLREAAAHIRQAGEGENKE